MTHLKLAGISTAAVVGLAMVFSGAVHDAKNERVINVQAQDSFTAAWNKGQIMPIENTRFSIGDASYIFRKGKTADIRSESYRGVAAIGLHEQQNPSTCLSIQSTDNKATSRIPYWIDNGGNLHRYPNAGDLHKNQLPAQTCRLV